MAPVRYSCSSSSVFFSLFSFKGFFICAIFGAVIWFGWPIIEAILILLPIPDPNSIKSTLTSAAAGAQQKLKGLQEKAAISNEPKDYRADFENAPSGMADDDDEEDDIGKEINRNLTFDSDEEGLDGGSNELINLD